MKKMKKKATKKVKKGFTLIELLVVIAIIAILSVVVVLTLNPAEMLRRSRDSNRTSDLSMIKTAIGLYLADVSSTSMGTSATCYYQWSGTNPGAGSFYEFASTTNETGANPSAYAANAAAACSQWFGSAPTNAPVSSSVRSVATAGGWIPINLSLVSSGAPIGQWPVDPAYSLGTNTCASGNYNNCAGHFYSYVPGATNNSYKLAAKMESTLYSSGGTGDVETTDGGTDPNMYEQGTNLAL
jgi:prepilin-type N-terminal cleavage/methylation domain-containing protein